jgi:hypothetical protein
MTAMTLHPGRLAASIVILAGVMVMVRPEHALTIAQLAAVTLAAGIGLHALLVSVPEWSSGPGWLLSPFDHGIRARRPPRVRGEIDRIRWGMERPRQRIAPGLWLTPQSFRLLRAALESGIESHAPGPDAEIARERLRARLSPLARTILTAEPGSRPPWYRARPPNPLEVATVVHQVLDEIESIDPDSPQPG